MRFTYILYCPGINVRGLGQTGNKKCEVVRDALSSLALTSFACKNRIVDGFAKPGEIMNRR